MRQCVLAVLFSPRSVTRGLNNKVRIFSVSILSGERFGRPARISDPSRAENFRAIRAPDVREPAVHSERNGKRGRFH